MKLALGTVQFGLAYGVSNVAGRVPAEEASGILALARARGIDLLDTAAAYGESEVLLGELGVDDWRIVSKLPPEIDAGADPAAWAKAAVLHSLARLRQPRLHRILLHRPDQLLGPGGDRIYAALRGLKRDGIVGGIGVSVYAPEELNVLCRNFDLDLVQAPLSLVDRRFLSSGWVDRLAAKGVELHVRSVFMQGLLLMRAQDRPAKFDRWKSVWEEWHEWLAATGLSATEACVRYALSQGGVDKVVVGVQSRGQLAEILEGASHESLEPPASLSVASDDLVNPARWAALH